MGRSPLRHTNRLLVVQRCMLMTTMPGDLILDQLAGQAQLPMYLNIGDVVGSLWTRQSPVGSRSPTSLDRNPPYFELKEPNRVRQVGSITKRKEQKRRTYRRRGLRYLGFAKGEQAKPQVLVDRPEIISGVTRVCGPSWWKQRFRPRPASTAMRRLPMAHGTCYRISSSA